MPNMLDAFLAMLRGEIPGQPVWTADITYWIAGRQQDGSARPEWSTEEGYLRLHNDLGILPYYYYEKFWAAEPRYDGRIELIETKEDGKSVRRFRTPAGELREESVYSPLSCSTGITKHFVESESNLDVLLDILRHRRLAAGQPGRLARPSSTLASLWRPSMHRIAAVAALGVLRGMGRRSKRQLFVGRLPAEVREASD